jgi:peptide deformylase
MVETMVDANGAGLAAPQVHVPLRLVIFQAPEERSDPSGEKGGLGETEQFDRSAPLTCLINPEILVLDGAPEGGWEGCLSVPGLRGAVSRFSMIRYHGFDQYGKPIDRVAEGFHARVVQHECDHLIGKLYPMRINDFAKFGFTEVLFPDMDPNSDD